MHPAYSVIFFTTASGAGYGLLFWLSLAEAVGAMPGGRWLSFAIIAVALTLISLGLLSSTLHLGHPERAIGAFSQWRSSWLSREGVAAVLTYIPAGLLALMWLFNIESGLSSILAILSAVGAAVTVYCTGMIYGSLRTIRQWSHHLVPLIYLGFAAATGALLFGFSLAICVSLPMWTTLLILVTTVTAAVMKISYWKQVDADPGQYTREMALGMPHLGTARPLDPPHSRPNFVMREMGYSVARNHAEKLRTLTMVTLMGAPIVLTLLAMLIGLTGLWLALAVIAAGVGIVTERWLFFAEAEHVSQLYYGAARA